MGPISLSALVLLLFMSLLFLLALQRHDNSIVDIGYGIAFVLAVGAAFLFAANGHPRQWLLLALIGIWGSRLAIHIFLRKQGENGEDFRYRRWRENWGKSFFWRSYLQIFLLQGAVVFLVCLPALLVMRQPGGPLGLFDLLGGLVWALGFGFEAVADWQLLHFKRDPRNRGRILQGGLWRYCRHPNYFGEALLWWGIYLIALGAGAGLAALVSPLLIGFLLLRVSGVPMLEAKQAQDPRFRDYQRRTHAFFPWFPKGTGEREE